MEKNKYVYIFLHLPKTGGTTFSDHISESLSKDEVLLTSRVRYHKTPDSINRKRVRVVLGHASYYGIHNLFPGKKPRYIVFLRDPAERLVSSYNFEMRTKKGKNVPFSEWYKSQVMNEMTYFLDMKYRGKEGTKINLPKGVFRIFLEPFRSKKFYMLSQSIFRWYNSAFHSSEEEQREKLENAKKLLDKCWHIGFVEDLDKSLKFLFSKMGIRGKWRDRHLTKKSEKIFSLDEKTRKMICLDNKYDLELYKYARRIAKARLRKQ